MYNGPRMVDILRLCFVARNVKLYDTAIQDANVKITHDISKNVVNLLQLERKRSSKFAWQGVRREGCENNRSNRSNRSNRGNRVKVQ